MLHLRLRLALSLALLLIVSSCSFSTRTGGAKEPTREEAPKKKQKTKKPKETPKAPDANEANEAPKRKKPKKPAAETKPETTLSPEPTPSPEPEPKADEAPARQPELSMIVLPIEIALPALEKEIDALLPTTDKKDWAKVTKGNDSPKAELKYELWRDPISIALEGHTFRIEVPVRYAATVRAQVKNPLTKDWFWIAKNETWGTKKDPQRLTARFEAKLRIADDWRIESELSLVKLEHGAPPSGDICKNAGIKVCVSKSSIAPQVREGIDAKLEPKLRKALAKLDSKVASAFNLRERASQAWAAMQVPQALPLRGASSKDAAWLVVRPTAIGVSRPEKRGENVRATLALEGRIGVAKGAKPAIAPLPLPKVSAPEGSPGFHVTTKLELPTSTLGDTLEKALEGASLAGKGQPKLALQRVRVSAANDAKNPRRLAVTVAFGADPSEELTLQGELAYDAKKQRLSVDDLQLTAGSKIVAAAKLAGYDLAALEKQLKSKARWDLRDQTGALTRAILEALGESLRGQASVRGELERLDVEKLELKGDVLEAEVIVGGTLAVNVTR